VTLAIAHTGMVSPYGLSPADHVFFLRAGLTAALSPFLSSDDLIVDAYACPWIDPKASVGDRLLQLAEGATLAAEDPRAPERPVLFLCVGAERPGLSADDIATLEAGLTRRIGAAECVRLVEGEAGFFRALRNARRRADDGAHVVVVAVDSFVSLEWVAHRMKNPPGPWATPPPPWSEGAAALYLQSTSTAEQKGRGIIGTVHASATREGASCDDNDEPVDGVAMTIAYSKLGLGRVHFAFGQTFVDSLRRREWFMMAARNGDQFRHGCAFECIESTIGSVGAAAGAMNLVYGLAMLRHRATPPETPRADPFVAWAISPDGVRGIASVSVEEAQDG
jgi:hypothetical protein